MEHLLFAAYLILFAWLCTRTRFFQSSGLSNPQLVILFLLKVMAGIFYGWMGTYYGTTAQMVDTWNHHQNGLNEYKLIWDDPQQYFTNIFHDPYENEAGVGKFFASTNSYWNDLKGNVFAKILSIFDVFSFGTYYVNVIFYSYLTLFGPIAIYRVMNDLFPQNRTAILLGTFLVPSFLYWGSGLHKEGAIALGAYLIIYHVYFGLKDKKWKLHRVLLIGLGLLLLLTLRNFILMILIAGIAAWVFAQLKPAKGQWIFVGFYLLCLLLFFGVRTIFPSLDFPQAVVEKQGAFIDLVGKTSVPVDLLQPTAASFVRITPQAFSLAILRPYPSDVAHIPAMAAALEIILFWVLVLLFLFYRNKAVSSNKIFLWFCLFFSLSFLLAIGFSVNNLGAIARYRSIIFPIVVPPLAAMIDWNKLANAFSSKN